LGPQEGILGQFFRADAPRRVFCKIRVQRVRIARRNILPTFALSGKREESATEGILEPSEGIFGRFFKIRGFRLGTPVAQKMCAACARIGASKIRATRIGILGADGLLSVH
jgi:hypothetical protein